MLENNFVCYNSPCLTLVFLTLVIPAAQGATPSLISLSSHNPSLFLCVHPCSTEALNLSLYTPSLYFFERGFFVYPGCPWTVCRSGWPTCRCLPSAWIEGMHHHLWLSVSLYMNEMGTKLRSHNHPSMLGYRFHLVLHL